MVAGLDSNATGDNYNPDTDWGRQFHWWDRAGQKAAWWDPGGKLLEDSPDAEAERQRRALLNQQAAAAGGFANQGQQGFTSYGQQGQGALDALRRQANGENSVSQLQLRQALQQQLAQQRSMAAGASPRNAGMAARTAAIQMGRASTAAAGQQSLAGLQERNQAQNNYAQLLQGLRQQDLQAALQSRQTATQGYGAQNAGQPEKTNMEKYGPAISSGLAAMFSDRALKTNVQSGDSKANAAMDGLKPYTYAYKDQALGAGPQVGVMAGDVRKVIPQAVITVPDGPYAGKLALDPGKLSGANTAMIAALNRRVQALEGGPDDSKAARAQEDLNNRRAKLQEVDLRESGAYPVYRPFGDLEGTAAQNELDRRRAMMATLARNAQLAQAGR